MANVKISELPISIPTSTSVFPFVDGGTTYQGAISAITSGGIIEKTKSEIDVLISTNGLMQGITYKITGVHPTLYNDGISSGATVYLQAIETNQLSKEGVGKFYNPKYDKQITNYGIWDKYNKFESVSMIIGTSQNFENITADNGATGVLLINASSLYFYNTTGDWSTAATFTGNSSSSEASIGGTTLIRSYSIGDKAIWGGYSWTNLNGNIGSDIDCLTLDGTEWSKDTFDEVNYNIVYDIITYDYVNDWITTRHEIEPNNIVSVSKNDIDNQGWSNFCAISVFQFGNGIDNNYQGIGGNTVSNSYVENINFKGYEFYINSFNTGSALYDNIFIGNSYFDESYFAEYSSFGSNIIVSNSGCFRINLYGGSSIGYNTLSNGSWIGYNTLSNAIYINNNTLTNNSAITNNTLSSASGIQNNTLTNNSYITNNTLNNGSLIIINTLNNSSYIEDNTLSNSSFNFNTSGTLSSVSIRNINANYSNATDDISAATIIYGNYSKEMFRNSSGVTRLSYYDGSDTLNIVNVNN